MHGIKDVLFTRRNDRFLSFYTNEKVSHMKFAIKAHIPLYCLNFGILKANLSLELTLQKTLKIMGNSPATTILSIEDTTAAKSLDFMSVIHKSSFHRNNLQIFKFLNSCKTKKQMLSANNLVLQ